MRKLAIILLLLMYGSATMGATVHMHYCMDEYIGASLWHGKEDNKCGKCGMEDKKNSCCKDEHKQVKLTSEHQSNISSSIFKIADVVALVTPIINFDFNPNAVAVSFPVSHAPPPPTERLYILHCVFLI